MKKGIYAVSIIMIIVFSLLSCKKKEEQPVPQVLKKGPIIDTPSSAQGHGATSQKIEFRIVVPQDVKENWASVKMLVKDKNLNEQQEFNIAIGGELKVPDSNMTIKVGHFLPHFQMGAGIITSASNMPENPSASIKVLEGDTQIFPPSGEWGWLYSKFPSVHPFEHERFELSLKEGVKK
jgi:hypothetical protein